MNRPALRLLIGLLLLAVGCGSDPTGPLLQPNELCSGQPANAIVTFEDANLEVAVREALFIGAQEDLTCSLISELTGLTVFEGGIVSLAGIQNLTSLTRLFLARNSITDVSALGGLTSLTSLGLSFNSITDISPLSGLTGLTSLDLNNNLITDISALSGLTSLTGLFLASNSITDISPLSGLTSLFNLNLRVNSITDISALGGLTLTILSLGGNSNLSNIQPLLDNTGLGAGDQVSLANTSVSCADVAALEAKGVTVDSDCP